MSLMQPILRQWNRITGGGSEFSVTVPVMDGPLKPNDAIGGGWGGDTCDGRG